MRIAPVLAVLLSVSAGACSDDGTEAPEPEMPRTQAAPSEPAAGRITSSDGSISLELPAGHARYGDEDLDGVVVLFAARRDDIDEQVIVSTFSDREAAEDAAIYAATTVAGQGGRCARDAADTTFGAERLVLDCAFGDPEAFHKVFVVLGGDRRGALLTVQTAAISRAGTRDVVAPILSSWRWEE